MANHLSAKKRIRSNHAKYLRNRYQLKTCRTFMKKVKHLTDKTAALQLLPKVSSMLDKLAASNIIHKNKSAHSKAQLAKHINSLIAASS
ncbi:30S ribosomal protein S20 [Candidatus Cardinium hertigii]|uniref:Small ribosomal subunit protein bS20 n=1 Tax=Candidatus Cardinium hertigii TaxID=247481 RepID=A0A2Z3LH31_9BACT|nr:30S ribosomal protein S20 [Candidatus Cardinium hertigii]AWN81815.1 30S ribosomal protein S20 [Candidatus Cardinium hertigii]